MSRKIFLRYQKLSEGFIHEFQNQVNLETISSKLESFKNQVKNLNFE